MQEKLAYGKQEKNWELIIIVFEIGFLFISMMDQLITQSTEKQILFKRFKISAINDYLNGEGSLQDICTKYGIRSHRQLSDWIKVYNSGGILKTSTGGAYMKKAKNTTLDERLKIVTDCLANDKNYGAMALKYDCSYQQVRNWVIRYEKMGQAVWKTDVDVV